MTQPGKTGRRAGRHPGGRHRQHGLRSKCTPSCSTEKEAVGQSSGARGKMAMDLILKGGRIVDPSQHLDAVADIGFAGGKVAAIGPDLAADVATEVRDVSGLIVTPG